MNDQPQTASTHKPKTSFYRHAARFSLFAPLIVFIMSHTISYIVVDPISKRIIAITGLSLVLAGFISAAVGLWGTSKYGRKGIFGLAIAGLLINGLYLILTFLLIHALGKVKESRAIFAERLDSAADVLPNSVRIVDLKAGFRLELPEGFEEHEQGYTHPRIMYSYIRSSPDQAKSFLVNIERLGGVISAEKVSEDVVKQMLWSLPPGSELKEIEQQWKGHKLQAFSIQMNISGQAMTVNSVQIPLAYEAIQIDVAGPAGTEDECNSILSQILKSVRGKSNWE